MEEKLSFPARRRQTKRDFFVIIYTQLGAIFESIPVLREGRKGSHMAIERQRDRQLFTSLMMPHSPPQNERGAVRRSSATLPRTATINCVSLLPCSHVCQTDQCICLWLQKRGRKRERDDLLRFLERSIPVRVVSRSLRSGRSDRRRRYSVDRTGGGAGATNFRSVGIPLPGGHEAYRDSRRVCYCLD